MSLKDDVLDGLDVVIKLLKDGDMDRGVMNIALEVQGSSRKIKEQLQVTLFNIEQTRQMVSRWNGKTQISSTCEQKMGVVLPVMALVDALEERMDEVLETEKPSILEMVNGIVLANMHQDLVTTLKFVDAWDCQCGGEDC